MKLGGCPPFQPAHWAKVKARALSPANRAVQRTVEEKNRVARVLEMGRRDVLRIADDPDDAHRGRRVDRAGGRLIVEADVAAGDRDVERAATLGESVDRLLKLVEIFRIVRIAEVEVGGQRQ